LRLLERAPIGIGTVVAVSRTGLTVNDQPQLDIELDVDTPDGRSTARLLVDLTELSAVRPGVIVPVRYLDNGKVAPANDATPAEIQAACGSPRAW
jgi:hypothetical protein